MNSRPGVEVSRAAPLRAASEQLLTEQAVSARPEYALQAFLGESAAARSVRDAIRQLLPLPVTALILSGETGTGKGLVARILHHSGTRKKGPLVELNCAALPPELVESELFGYEPGAFTSANRRRRGLIEQADGGTLFLDEIGELSPELQVKLVSVIEERRFWRLGGEQRIGVDCQVIAASHRDLGQMVRGGSFRADLYHRLNVFSIGLPPLRSRIEDLDQLVPAFIRHFNSRAGQKVQHVPDQVWARLRSYHWPGNVRELRNVLERCVLLAEGKSLSGQWLKLEDENPEPTGSTPSPPLYIPTDGSMTLDDMERRIVERTFQTAGHNLSRAARALGISRGTLRDRLHRYGIHGAGKAGTDSGPAR